MAAGKFSRYEIRGELGTGGMAEVYRAYDPLFDREVALKVLRREMLAERHLRERFERETRILANLELEGIVPVYDVGLGEDGRLFYVMRLMTGGTLAERIQNGPLSSGQILRILQRIAPALDNAHAKGIVHRDLKPGNILFDEQDNAYLADFGIAKSNRLLLPNATTSGDVVVGTPRYMSPEQARGAPVDARTDLYSLGVIVFEMMVGKTNFDAITPLGLAFTLEPDEIDRLLDTNPALPDGVRVVMEKAMARDRDLRYGSAAAFAALLAGALVQPQSLLARRKAVPLWIMGMLLVLLSVVLTVWAVPKFSLPVSRETQTAAATGIPPTPANPPTATDTMTPTATSIAIVSARPSIGGADRIALTANNDIYLMDTDGGSLESLTSTHLPKLDLQWLPGGSALIYIEGNCVYKIEVETRLKKPEQLVCFKDPSFQGFRLSPDGKWAAVSIAHRLLVLPFDLPSLSRASSAFELQQLEGLCMDYAKVSVRDALWSADGQDLAVRYQSVVNGRIGDTIRVIRGDWERCRGAEPIPLYEFPARVFVPEGYAKYPLLPSYQWDGGKRFLLNTFIRNKNYGNLYLYDGADRSPEPAGKINPIERACCYGSAAFSPDGSYILLVFQDIRRSPDNKIQLYYIPIDQIGTGTAFTPLPLSSLFFTDDHENIQLALHPSQTK